MGMFVNAGDCQHTPDCLDSDFGATADRVTFSTELYGLRATGIFEWAATGPTSNNLAIGVNQFQGEPYDVTNRDDVSQYGLMFGKLDTPAEWADKISRLDSVWNLGTYIFYRSQDLDQTFGSPIPIGGTIAQVGETLVKRNAETTTIDVWGRWKWHHLLIEGEGAVILGNIGDVRDFTGTTATNYDVRQGGAVGRIIYSALHDTLHLKFEAGFATGDQAESQLPGSTNYMLTPIVQPPGDHTITNFHFDPDYHVDLILFRRLIGTVTNAIYAKPSLQWDATPFFTGIVDFISSFADVPVSTPGNAIPLGLEIDTTIAYKNVDEGFYAGFQYGVLFPFSALDEPNTGLTVQTAPGGIFPAIGSGSASAAQTLRVFMAVKF
jgi:uncharacterized protein (TIGR04551 family)